MCPDLVACSKTLSTMGLVGNEVDVGGGPTAIQSIRIVVRRRHTHAAGDGGADGRKGNVGCHFSGRLQDIFQVCDR
jgi:hypothetical protein